MIKQEILSAIELTPTNVAAAPIASEGLSLRLSRFFAITTSDIRNLDENSFGLIGTLLYNCQFYVIMLLCYYCAVSSLTQFNSDTNVVVAIQFLSCISQSNDANIWLRVMLDDTEIELVSCEANRLVLISSGRQFSFHNSTASASKGLTTDSLFAVVYLFSLQ